MKNKNLDLALQLQRLCSMESMLVDAMPRMIQKAANFGLQKTLALHFEETRQHEVVVKSICKQLDFDATLAEPDQYLKQILQEGEKLMMNLNGNELDKSIIRVALQVEQYEIIAYEPVSRLAQEAGYEGIAQRLRLTLEEEKQSDTKLRFLAKSLFSKSAAIGEMEFNEEASTHAEENIRNA